MRNVLRRLLVKLPALTLAVGSCLCLFLVASVAFAQAAAPVGAETPPEDLAKAILQAVTSSNWRLAGVLALMLVVWAIRKYGGKVLPVLLTDRGGVALAMGTAIVGGIANGVIAGKPLNLSLILYSVFMGLAAMGTWTGAKNVVKAPSA